MKSNSQTPLYEKHVHVGSSACNNIILDGRLTHFAHHHKTRNHQQKKLVVARVIAFAHKIFSTKNKSAKCNITSGSS